VIRARATVQTEHAARLARKMGRHFGHKVRVETDGDDVRVWIPAGEFSLHPDGGRLQVEAAAADASGLERVQAVTADHLMRFARPEPIEIAWAPAP
jgi:uncharacterized protein